MPNAHQLPAPEPKIVRDKHGKTQNSSLCVEKSFSSEEEFKSA